ncbi:13599_t:CDS:2 [Dentiscutata heterogama]|uniref:13599_t:CDS:1 n=1 Tax=Dentiscutata heterogama TaxID=1316150 RepID=A0ACA9KHY9_9GLOM|nr:13599_t:CDS:2 [Dentiscutata heterogama]
MEILTDDAHDMDDDNVDKFTLSISNLVGVCLKSQRQKNANETLVNTNKVSRIGTDKNLTSQEEMVGMNKGGGNDQNKHSLLTTSHNVESLNSENMVDHAHHENRSRHCGACGQIGHNARTCNLNFSSKDHHENVNQSPLQIVDDNVGVNDHTNNKICRCGTCGQVGHNARTCNSKSSS